MICATLKGVTLKLKTSKDLFSPNQLDKGTLAMLSQVEFKQEDKVLDLGCGYGLVGILAAKLIGERQVVMVDIQDSAVSLAKENALLNQVGEIKVVPSDGFKNLDEQGFTLIISHPPYHVDFSVPKGFIEKGFNRLALGGKMYMVTKRKEWYKNKFIAIFGGVKITEIDDYFVFVAEKRSSKYANKST